MGFKILHAADRLCGHLHDALADPARRERNLILTLTVYVAMWTVYAVVTKSAHGLHPDMIELLDWSRDLSFGYPKHPPFAAWLVRLWFTFFPVASWSYYLLAMTMPAVTLWMVWRLSADYLDIEKRIFGLALLTLVPFFNFHALKFNVNTVLMPLWAATTFWFLRSYTTRSKLFATFAGIAAAAAMLGKYWSIFLIAGLVVAALTDSRRAAYFHSAAPWITAAVGLVALTPHLIWLTQHDYAPLTYALNLHDARIFSVALVDAFKYLEGALAYVAAPLIITLAVERPGRTALADMIWPGEHERRLVAVSFWVPLLLPALAAVISRVDITSLWSMSAWTLLPIVLLSPPGLAISPRATRGLLGFAVALPLAMLIASPVILQWLMRR